ncbi:hypothetical protein [Roseibium salinum]|uniref:Uncharacterized protein n=1 Tax=Roseibium salinum TaxID=1604349 RepID=A0ABT3QY97_9HYPH|nr:hypothetical protein [Roseibium sp. DSM 29163]MCX2721823.1 hypothetical protein [Roseibium sp. DSM 29163]
MKEIPQGKDLEDLIIQYATVLAGNEQLCNLMLRQEEIAYDDPMGARDIQVELNWASYEFSKEQGFEGHPDGPLIGPLKLAQRVVVSMLKGELKDLSSEETRQFIRRKLIDSAWFYGVD